MLDKPCFIKNLRMREGWRSMGELMRKREVCYLRSIRKSAIAWSVSDISLILINLKKRNSQNL
jgi:hypothetical protein